MPRQLRKASLGPQLKCIKSIAVPRTDRQMSTENRQTDSRLPLPQRLGGEDDPQSLRHRAATESCFLQLRFSVWIFFPARYSLHTKKLNPPVGNAGGEDFSRFPSKTNKYFLG